MKLTNNAGLPTALVEAIENDSYTRGSADISVTSLISPPRQQELIRVHGAELEEEASDRIFSLLGQAIHTILERASVSGVAEERLYADVGGWRISGQIDHMENGVIQDYKTASVNEITRGVREDRTLQLNCYAYLARANGIPVERIEAIFILRDWSKRRASQDPSYPQKQVVVHELPLWSQDRAQSYIEERVRLHQDAHHELPECTDGERWAQADVWAVMKEGNKRAVKLCDWEAEAVLLAESKGKDHYVVRRPGESIRCSLFCGAAPVCSQWKGLSE